MRFLDILLMMGFVLVLYWFTRKGKKRTIQTEETAFTPHNNIDIATSPLFHFPKASEGAATHYVVIDTETTELIPPIGQSSDRQAPLGSRLPAQLPPIVRLSWSLLDARGAIIQEESHTLLQNTPISKEAEAIHGISNEEMLRSGENPQDVYRRFLEHLSMPVTIVGHHLDFHLQTIEQDMARHDLFIPNRHSHKLYCTMQEGSEYLRERYALERISHLKLNDLYGMLYFGRRDLVITYRDKSRRDILLAIACLRFLI